MVVCSDDGRRLRTQDEGGKGGKEEGGRTDGHLDEETEGGFEVDGGTRMRRESDERTSRAEEVRILEQTHQQQSRIENKARCRSGV